MIKAKTETLELIDKNQLIKKINYLSEIGGTERLLSRQEVISSIKDCHVWEEKEITRI